MPSVALADPNALAIDASPLEIGGAEARELIDRGATLIDVRDADERIAAPLDAALAVPLAELLESGFSAARPLPRPWLFVCAIGQRSRRAAEASRRLCVADARSISGGVAGLRAVADSAAPDNAAPGDAVRLRYARQLALPEIGAAGQAKLAKARVALVGTGGLGCPAALYLAAAGVGYLRLIDPDHVELSNLQRQVLYGDDDIALKKVHVAERELRARASALVVDAHAVALAPDNVEGLIADIDIVIDGSDNFAARDALNRACVALDKPMISAAVERFAGQLAVWWPAAPGHRDAPCYACAFPAQGGAERANCAALGVLGVVPGVLGVLEASEAIKLIVGFGEPAIGRLIRFDAATLTLGATRVRRDPDCAVCAAGGDSARGPR